MKVFITGVAGTGKSTMARTLKERGHNAIDIDSDTDIGYSRNMDTGQKENVPQPRPAGWRLNHRWYWDAQKMTKFLKDQAGSEPVFICGFSENQADFYDYFDKLIVLTTASSLIVQRLMTRSGEYGKQEIERDDAVKAAPVLLASAQKAGAIILNTEQPVEQTLEDVLTVVHDG